MSDERILLKILCDSNAFDPFIECMISFPDYKIDSLLITKFIEMNKGGIQALLSALAGDIISYDKYYCSQCNKRIKWNIEFSKGECLCGKRYHDFLVKSLYRHEKLPEKNEKIKVCLGSGTYNSQKEIIAPLQPLIEFCNQHGIEVLFE